MDASEMTVLVEALVGDDGSGDNGIIIRQALEENPRATAEEIAEIIREARENARTEKEWDAR